MLKQKQISDHNNSTARLLCKVIFVDMLILVYRNGSKRWFCWKLNVWIMCVQMHKHNTCPIYKSSLEHDQFVLECSLSFFCCHLWHAIFVYYKICIAVFKTNVKNLVKPNSLHAKQIHMQNSTKITYPFMFAAILSGCPWISRKCLKNAKETKYLQRTICSDPLMTSIFPKAAVKSSIVFLVSVITKNQRAQHQSTVSQTRPGVSNFLARGPHCKNMSRQWAGPKFHFNDTMQRSDAMTIGSICVPTKWFVTSTSTHNSTYKLKFMSKANFFDRSKNVKIISNTNKTVSVMY